MIQNQDDHPAKVKVFSDGKILDPRASDEKIAFGKEVNCVESDHSIIIPALTLRKGY